MYAGGPYASTVASGMGTLGGTWAGAAREAALRHEPRLRKGLRAAAKAVAEAGAVAAGQRNGIGAMLPMWWGLQPGTLMKTGRSVCPLHSAGEGRRWR